MNDRTEPEREASEQDPHLLEHEYDGIREYDNPMPRWWVQLFWGSVVFAVGYLVHYHGGQGQSVLASYDAEMRRARKPGESVPASEDGLMRLASDAKHLSAGKGVFASRCTPCHGDRGQGVVGPNLTDGSWISGAGTLVDIHGVVANGVPEKGMPAWSKQLSPDELDDVVAFVGSIRGTAVPGKPPEGKEVERR